MTEYERATTRETHYTDPARPAADASVRTTERVYEPSGPSGMTTVTRLVTFIFGILQAALILRIVLLLLIANPGNDLVAAILGVTDPFVEPFRGMFALDRISADQGSVFDVAAVVALIGWTLVEALIIAALRIFDREAAATV